MNHNVLLFLLAIAITLVAVPAARAQDKLTLEDLYSKNTYGQRGFGPVRWMKDGSGYSSLKGGDILRYDAKTGEQTVLVSAKQLTPEGAKSPLGIDDYQWS